MSKDYERLTATVEALIYAAMDDAPDAKATCLCISLFNQFLRIPGSRSLAPDYWYDLFSGGLYPPRIKLLASCSKVCGTYHKSGI